MDGKQTPEQPGTWQFIPDEQAAATAPYTGTVPTQAVAIPPTGSQGSITWTASEFIAHHKTTVWYVQLAGAALLAAVVIGYITKDIITALTILFAAGLLAAYGNRQPRELTYRLDYSGLHVGRRVYHLADFRSFSVMTEGAFASISFTPLKRFAPMLTIYYDPKDEQKIVDVLSAQLPMLPRKIDPIERLMWRIRF